MIIYIWAIGIGITVLIFAGKTVLVVITVFGCTASHAADISNDNFGLFTRRQGPGAKGHMVGI